MHGACSPLCINRTDEEEQQLEELLGDLKLL